MPGNQYPYAVRRLLAALFILSLSIFTSYSQENKDIAVTQRIERYLSGLEKIGFFGSVLVEKDGEILISKGYGYSNIEGQVRNSPATIYDIGSITKQFTAAAILKLEMLGKLSTEDKLSGYFKNVPKDKENITIHDLLRHQSGLTSTVGGDYEIISRDAFVDKVFASPLRFEPGSSFSYSNIGYSLLAMIIEKVSGQTYETYLYNNLWKPAQMEMTGYTRPAFDTNLIAVGYSGDNKVWGKPTHKKWDNAAPYWNLKGNGGILSTTGDLYKWHKALMSDRIISKEAREKLYHPKLRKGENENSIYAYGWDVSKTNRNTTQVWHNGTNNIFYADFLRYIDEDVTLIMYTNKSHPNFDRLNFEIAKMIFNKQYQPEIPVEDNETNRKFTSLIITILEESGLEKAKTEYKSRNKSENLLEFVMRNEGFAHLDDNKPDTAIRIFEMNVFAYPNSAAALQGLGEGYMETGKKKQALQYFRQSLGINPDNPFVKDMIKKLEE